MAAFSRNSDIANGTDVAASKTTPVDADEIPLVDTAASNALKKLTLANLKAALARSVVNVNTTTTLTVSPSGNYYVRLAAGSGLTIPTAVGFNGTIVLKNIDTAATTVSFTSGQTADGSSSITLQPNGSVTLISNQTNWEIF